MFTLIELFVVAIWCFSYSYGKSIDLNKEQLNVQTIQTYEEGDK